MEGKTRQIICINCPVGCNITVEYEDIVNAEGFKITGNTCKRGLEYAITELTDPKRTVTSTVPVDGNNGVRISVKTALPIPKDKIMDVMKEIHGASASAPVRIGDVIIHNCAGTGVDIIATDYT